MKKGYSIVKDLAEAGIELFVACPEIATAILEFIKPEEKPVRVEWAINERCTFEAAYGAAMVGSKAACLVGRPGLNMAFPPLMQAGEKRVDGAFVVVCFDDTEAHDVPVGQGAAFLASHFRIPYFEYSPMEKTNEFVARALEEASKQKVPVIIDVKASLPTVLEFPQKEFVSTIKNFYPEVIILSEENSNDMETGRHVSVKGSLAALAGGLFDAFKQSEGDATPIMVLTNSSTFFHSYLSAFYDMVQKKKRFVLFAIDEGNVMVDAPTTRSMKIEEVLHGLGVQFQRSATVSSPELLKGAANEALEYLKRDGSLPAVIVIRSGEKGL